MLTSLAVSPPPYIYKKCGCAHLVLDRCGTNVYHNGQGAVFFPTEIHALSEIYFLEREYYIRKRYTEEGKGALHNE